MVSGLMLVAVMFFSGLAQGESCKGLPGELLFRTELITVPEWAVANVAQGMSLTGKTAIQTALYENGQQSRTQLVIRNKDGGMQVIGDYGADNYFSLLFMTGSDAVVGYRSKMASSVPAVITTGNKEVSLASYGTLIAAQSDSSGKVYVLINQNNDWVLHVVSKGGTVLSETTVAKESGYIFFGYGGISIDEGSGTLFLAVPVSKTFNDGSHNSIRIIELNLENLTQKNDPYTFSWDSPWEKNQKSKLPVYFGGIDGKNLLGWYNGQSFIYDLTDLETAPRIIAVCPSEHSMPQGIFLGKWVIGGVGSSSLFFQRNDGSEFVAIVDFPMSSMGYWGMNGEQILVHANNYSDFYILSLRNYVKH